MKKTLLLFFLFASINTFAQVNIGPVRTVAPNTSTDNFVGANRGDLDLYIDYSYLNNDPTSTRWSLNSYYTAADTAVNFIGVAFDNICGYYDYVNYATTIVNATDLGFSSVYPNDVLLRYDSLQAFVAHENNSGQADTIIVELREVNSNGAISTNVLWADSVITDVGLSPGNTWSNGIQSFFFMRFAVGYSTTAGQKAGVVFRYLNHNKLDTFGLAAGYVPFSPSGVSALQSNYKNSFLRYPPFANSIIRNADFQITIGGYLAGQNWVIIPRALVYNTAMGLQSAKGNINVLSMYPNPATQWLNVKFESEKNLPAMLTVVNTIGQVVKQVEIPSLGANVFMQSIDCSDLDAGMYAVSIVQDNQSYSQRIIISAK